jgi:hypothetical protein
LDGESETDDDSSDGESILSESGSDSENDEVSSTDGSVSDDEDDRKQIDLTSTEPQVIQLFNQVTQSNDSDVTGLQLIDDSDDDTQQDDDITTKEVTMHSELLETDNLDDLLSVEHMQQDNELDILDGIASEEDDDGVDDNDDDDSNGPVGPIDPNLPPLDKYLEDTDIEKMKVPELRDIVRKYRLHVNPKNIKKKELIELIKNNI